MKKTVLFTLMTLNLWSVVSWSHPLDGTWKIKHMYCTARPEKLMELRPVLGSYFKPDIQLQFTFSDVAGTPITAGIGSQKAESDEIVIPLGSTKATTTASCTDQEAQSIPGFFFKYTLNQEAHFSPSNETHGRLTGLSLGPQIQTTTKEVTPFDCDWVLGIWFKLFGDHKADELARVYTYDIEGHTLKLSYKDTLLGGQCNDEEDGDTVLVFERTAGLQDRND
jgi:hypothetical protein